MSMVLFQLLDADYALSGGKPLVRLFGRTENGNPVCVFHDHFSPYFYATPNSKTHEWLSTHAVQSVEEVERFIPIGYQTSPVPMLKITLANPQDVAAMRENILAERAAEDVYEADILFKYRFMVDHDLHGMGWVEAAAERTFTKSVSCATYRMRSITPVERTTNAQLKYLAFDIECLPGDPRRELDSKRDPIIIISLAFEPDYMKHKSLVLMARPATQQGVKGLANEKEMLEEFATIIERFDPDIITGYNINSFDLPYLLERMKKHNVYSALGRAKDKPAYMRSFGASQECTIPGRVVADPYQILKRDPWVKFPRYDLNTVAKILLGDEKLAVEYSEMPALWNGAMPQLQRLIDYARKDAELSLRLVLEKQMLDKFFELAKISGSLLQDTMGGQTMRIEVMLLHELRKRGFVMPPKPRAAVLSKRLAARQELKGAVVLEPKRGLHTSYVLVLDFKSLYPSIMRSFNVSPDTLLPGPQDGCVAAPNGTYFVSKERYEGILPSVLTTLTTLRAAAKTAMRSAHGDERRILNAKQLALKDIANSVYGMCGYVRARLYTVDVANAITAFGRRNLETTKGFIEKQFPAEVVYGDTDSIFLKTALTDPEEARLLGETIAATANKELTGHLELEFEKAYRTFLILTKKRYAGLRYTPDSHQKFEMEMKGIETVRRDWCPLVTETMRAILDIILAEGDTNKAVTLVKETQAQLKEGAISLDKLTIIKGISKSIESYEGMLPHIELAKKLAERNPSDQPKVGDRLGFVIIRGNEILSKRAEDPRYVEKNKTPIDAHYYLYSQLLPPIERIFEALGVSTGELLGVGRQTSIFQAVSKKAVLGELENFVCARCSQKYRRIPLQGVCSCGGELQMHYHGTIGTKTVNA